MLNAEIRARRWAHHARVSQRRYAASFRLSVESLIPSVATESTCNLRPTGATYQRHTHNQTRVHEGEWKIQLAARLGPRGG